MILHNENCNVEFNIKLYPYIIICVIRSWTTGIGVSVISTLQSVGAAGMGAAATGVAGATGAAAGKAAKEAVGLINTCEKCKEGQAPENWNYCPHCGKKLKKD